MAPASGKLTSYRLVDEPQIKASRVSVTQPDEHSQAVRWGGAVTGTEFLMPGMPAMWSKCLAGLRGKDTLWGKISLLF